MKIKNRQQFLENFRCHVMLVKNNFPNQLYLVETRLNGDMICRCPFNSLNVPELTELGFFVNGTWGILYQAQADYFNKWENNPIISQMIQVYCEVVF